MLRQNGHASNASQSAMAFGLRGDDGPATACMPIVESPLAMNLSTDGECVHRMGVASWLSTLRNSVK